MDFLWISLGIIFLLGGIAGALLPVLPGPPVSFLGVLFLSFSSTTLISQNMLWWLVVFGVVFFLLDYWLPIYAVKKFGGSKLGMRISFVGLILGIIFFPPLGFIIGPFVGALLGEAIHKNKLDKKALKAAIGSFVGFLAGTGLKLVYAGYCILVAIKNSF